MTRPIKFFTPVDITPQKDKISCDSSILTIGSCFSEHIGNCLSNHLFDAIVNPFGTIFNPISIGKVLELAMNRNEIVEADLDAGNNRYFHYDFHSSFDNSSALKVIENTNNAIKKTASCLPNLDFLMITFGSSIVYKLKSNNQIVANCHKVHNQQFQKELLSTDFMEERVESFIKLIKRRNTLPKIILTVSPVRHTKDGLIANNLSKSRLVDLCHRMVEKDDAISYFPAFEIMMDELRDYRYYQSDLIHPSELAIDIIWSRFMEAYFDATSIQKVKDMSELIAAKNHTPFNPNSQEHRKFKLNQLEKIEKFKGIYPEVDFQEMIDFFSTND